jgi:CHAT domain-containing protein
LLVSWFVLPDRIVAFALRGTDIAVRISPLARGALLQAVLEQAGTPSGHARDDAIRRLSEWLIRPLEGLMRSDDSLAFITHDVLAGISFAELTTADGRRLVERHPVVTSPSVAVFQSATTELGRHTVSPPRSLLALADPAFDRSAFPQLARLPGAKAEAEAVARLYSAPFVAVAERATGDVLMERLPASDVVHIAAHGQINERSPALSGLLLAPSPQRDSLLVARELSWAAPVRTRVVVLGACRSAAGPVAEGEGVMSLARPFLRAGVPSVIGALWDIDDELSARLLVRLHAGLAAGLSAPEALWRAQREMAASSDPRMADPRNWAAFVAIGGYSHTNKGANDDRLTRPTR